VLLVREVAAVVNHLEGVAAAAVFAAVRLQDAATLDQFVFLKPAFHALKAGLLHFWDDIRVSDHDTLNRYQLVNVAWVKVSDPVVDSKVEGFHLDKRTALVAAFHYLGVARGLTAPAIAGALDIEIPIELGDYQVEDGDDVGGVVD
jgi:hypothetical protein